MHITHITETNFFDPDSWSGTPYWIAKGLTYTDIQLHNVHLSLPAQLLPPMEEFKFRCLKVYRRLVKGTYLAPEWHMRRSIYVGNHLNNMLSHTKTNAILTTHTPILAACLDINIPLIYWTDAAHAQLMGIYPSHWFHDPDTMWDSYTITVNCLTNAKLVIFSSDWAARGAMESYGISKNKIKVVPFGANLDIQHHLDDVKQMIRVRPKNCIKLLF